MSDGKWTGGHTGVDWRWIRPGSRLHAAPGDTPELRARLWEENKHTPFWCDNCGGCHPLAEHRDCRAENPFRSAYRGAA